MAEIQAPNVLGSYIQGLEYARANKLARQQEAVAMQQAQREADLRNFLSTADLTTPEAQNALLKFGKPGAELAASLADIAGKRATAEKTGLETRGLEVKMADENYGRFQKMLADLAYAETLPTKAQVLDNLDFMIAQGTLVPQFRDFATTSLPDDPTKLQTVLRGQFLSQIPPAERAKLFVPMSAQKFAQEKDLRQASRSSQVVNLPPAEGARATTLGKAGAEALVAEFNAATSASKGLAKDYEALSVLRSGKPATGITSELQVGVDRLRSAVAGDPAAAERVSDSQYLEALLGSDVFAQMQSLGVGARGLDTPAEREFLREVISGTRKLDKNTLIRMAEMRAKYKEQAVDSWNERVRAGELDDFYKEFGRPKRELSKPTRPKSAEPSPGTPKTFANEAEAEAAFKAGKIKRGDRVTIGGVSGRWE